MANNRAKAKGRRETGRFLALPYTVLECEAYNQLGAWGLKLLIDIGFQYNGSNNGDLHAAWSILCKKGWNSKGTLNDSLKELQEKGFIQQTRQGGKNRCSLYAITWKPIDDCKGKIEVSPTRVASNLFKQYKANTE